MNRDSTTYVIMSKFCLTLENLGLAPYGLNIIGWKYFQRIGNRPAFCFRFWKKEDCAQDM